MKIMPISLVKLKIRSKYMDLLMKSIFDFKDYKKFLHAYEESRKSFERGFRSKLAEHLGCQNGYVTQVLSGEAHFSLEQGMRLANFLGLNANDRKYLLLLIEYARAGTKELRDYFLGEITGYREKFMNIKERVGKSRTLSETEQSVYYSSWHYLAIHMLVTLPGYDDPKSIAEALRLPDATVSQALIFLTQTGILREEQGKIKAGLTQIHLNRESPLIRQHHTNFRIAAIQSLTTERKSDVHYSTVSTLSKEDAEKLRAEMVKFVEKYLETIAPSKEETMFGFNLDFYRMLE